MRLPVALAAVVLAQSGCASPMRAGRRPDRLPAWVLARGDAGFETALRRTLGDLSGTRAGSELLGRLQAARATVVIRQRHLPTGMMTPLPARPVVWWNPDFGAPESPALTALHHELIHAYQHVRGEDVGEEWLESEAVGLGKFSAVPYSENKLREELGLPLRASHRTLPGFSDEALEALFHQAYLRQAGLQEAQYVPPAGGGGFPRIEVRVPDWVEGEGR